MFDMVVMVFFTTCKIKFNGNKMDDNLLIVRTEYLLLLVGEDTDQGLNKRRYTHAG
jgi:hypothetical protein